MANNDIRINISADVREAEASIKRLEEQFENMQRLSETSPGSSLSQDSREIDDATRRFQESYRSVTNSMHEGIDRLKNTMDELDRQLEQSQRASDTRTTQSIQAQKNAFDLQMQQMQEYMRLTEQMYDKQRQMHSASLPAGGGFGGGGSYSGPIYDSMPNSYNPNRTGGFGGGYGGFGGGGGNALPPGSSSAEEAGGGGGNGLTFSSLFGGFMGVMATRRIFGALNSGYDLMNRDEYTAYNVAQKTGDYGTNFTQARKDMEALGKATGHTMSETAQVASTYESIGGVTNTKNSLADVQAMQQFGRAYAVDPNQLAGVAGNMNRIGATAEGEQQKFASMLAQSIKEQGMSGRESELIESTNQLAQNVASAKTTVTGSDLTNIMAMQNMFGNMSPQLKGSQGASVLGSMNSNIQNADNGMQILLGRNTEFTGPEGMLQLRKQMEKGISDPENLSRILKNSEKFAGGNKSYQEMILMDKLGISSSVAEQLLSSDNYEDLKSGKRAQSEIEKITSSNGDYDKKLKDYTDSDVNRRKTYEANKENSSKAVGDLEDAIVTPWQKMFNSSGTGGQVAMNMVAGAGSIGMYSIVANLLKKGFTGGLGNMFKGAGGFGESVTSSMEGLAGGAEGLGEFASKTTGVIGKLALPITAAISAYEGYKGWNNAGETFGKNQSDTSFSEKFASSGASIVNGLTFGLFDKFFGDGAMAKNIKDNPLINAANPLSPLINGADAVKNWFSGDKDSTKRDDQQKEWKDILKTEEDIVKRREDLNKNSSKSNSDGTSNFWNSSGTAQNLVAQQQPKEKGFLEEVGDWFSNLFGGGKASATSSSGSGATASNLSYSTGSGKISSTVNGLRDTVSKYAQKYGVGDKVDLLMAQMMQESGGDAKSLADDPMQSAEGHGMAAGSLHDQEKSIDWGVQEFSQRLKDADGNVELALQSYNFGQGFIGYVKSHGGKMTQELINQFSNEQANKMGWKSYGDKNYVQHVMRYYQGGKSYAIGAKSLYEDGYVYAHKGEQIVRADENPNNPSNVSTSSYVNGVTGSSARASIGSNSFNLNITVTGTGFSPEHQSKIANAAAQVITNNQPQLLSMLANGMVREMK